MEHKTDQELAEIVMGKGYKTDHFVKLMGSFMGYTPTDSDPEKMKAVWEIARRYAGKRTRIYLKPRDVWEELRDIRGHHKEHFVCFFLNTRNQEIQRELVSMGTLNRNLVHPREVFRPAVLENAAAVIVAHNHPSGALMASDEDRALTRRLLQAGKLLGIELLDHIIVTKDGFHSMKERGEI